MKKKSFFFFYENYANEGVWKYGTVKIYVDFKKWSNFCSYHFSNSYFIFVLNFSFKSNDGISRQEEGKLITVDDKVGIAISGSYSYPGPDGEQYEVTFTADDKGYKPQIRVVSAGQQ